MGGKSTQLPYKQQLFISEYLKDYNATQAALRAGYRDTRALRSWASNLLRKPTVRAEIERRASAAMRKLEISAERVLLERARLAFFDPRRLFDASGAPRPINELDDDTAAAVAGVDVDAAIDERGRDASRIRYKLADKAASLTALEKHLGLYRDDNGDSAPLNIHIHLG